MKKKYWLCLKDRISSCIIPIAVEYKAGDIFRDDIVDHNTPTCIEISKELAAELKKIQTRMHAIEREQEKFYLKDMDYRNSQQWRYSRKLDGLAIEERNCKKEYAKLIFKHTGKEVEIYAMPEFGIEKIRERQNKKIR